jgi:nucleotide-binding universal stress UspA family protein
MFRTIVVPLDGSSFGEHALPLAISIAKRSGAALRLVHILRPFVEMAPELTAYQGPIEAEYRQEKQTYLNGVVQRIREVSPIPVSADVIEGEIAGSIREEVSDGKAELVVMSTHGRGPLARFWLGSVADELVRELPVPLLLVHPTHMPVDLKADPVFKNILLPLDGTPLAEQIIAPAGELARVMGASCTLFRVVHTDVPDTLYSGTRGAGVTQHHARLMVERLESLERQQREQAERYLETAAERLRVLGVQVQTHAVMEEQPAAAILHETEANFDLVALETHGYSGLKRLWLGSVADKVIRGSHVPVLVQRPMH